MSAGHLISASDRDLMQRITIMLVFVFIFTAAFARLERVYSDKFLASTGGAQWIWSLHRMSNNEPVAFFAVRDFTLPEKRYFTHLKIAGDPEYLIYLNGQELGGRRMGIESRVLDFYDISKLVKTGTNRIVVAVRAPQGMGGLLASIDIAPETQNWVVTDERWLIYREWDDDLRYRDVPRLWRERPAVIGPPPTGRWNYPTLERREIDTRPTIALQPRESFEMRTVLPTIRTRSGVAVVVADPVRARVFDFGLTHGRVRIISERTRGLSRVVRIRYASLREELGYVEWIQRPFVIAPGERSVTLPEEHRFRYVMLFGKHVRAEVVQTPPGQ